MKSAQHVLLISLTLLIYSNACHNFTRTGRCRFGDRCRFLHVVSGQSNSTIPNRERTPGLATTEAEFRAWKLSAPKRGDFFQLPATTLEKFFQKALDFVTTDLGIQQETIKTLADEGGLQRIRQLVEQVGDSSSTVPKDNIFRNQVVPLFHTFTHKDVVVSATLERYVADIVIFLYGPNGQRATKLFELVCDALKSIRNAGTAPSEQELASCFTASLLALHMIIVMNGSAAVNDNLRLYAVELCSLAEQWISSGNEEFVHEALQALRKTQHCLGLAAALPAAAIQMRATMPKAKFIIQQDPPGGRHDNDFADISQIQILPTYAEILCPRQEYLPLIDLSQNHLQGVPGLLDRHFRLLREDTVGQLRLAVKAELEYFQGGAQQHQKQRQQGARTYTYTNVCIEGVYPEQRAGFCFKVSFDQPAHHMSDAERRDWWAQSKRLDPNALVCLVDSAGSASFCTVHEHSKPKDRTNLKSNDFNGKTSQDDFRTLYTDREKASVLLVLEDMNQRSLKHILTAFKHPDKPRKLSLIEFPGILLAGFAPTLRALQHIKQAGDLPLANLLLSAEHGGSGFTEVSPPAYVRKADFQFNLRCLTKTGDTDIFLKPGEPFDLPKFQDLTTLDQSQATALIESLSKELALIQGPPGTGKSFVGVELIKVLLANKKIRTRFARQPGADIGPILIVCYTNHALDQLLEHLVAAGVKQIIRIGARSKSEVLEECNLRVITRKSVRTKHDNWCIAMQHKYLEETGQRLNRTLETINKAGSLDALKNHLSRTHPHHHSQLFRQADADGFIQQNKTNNVDKMFHKWLWSGEPAVEPRPKRDLVKLPLHSLSQQERLNLYEHWVDEILENLSDELNSGLIDHKSHMGGLNDIYGDFDLRCLQTANVIGVTCTGLAKNLQTLRKLNSKVLLCEEAGEVLEAHLLTAFLPSLQHIFLIGDHLQLMPQIENFDLSRESSQGAKHSLNVSLFERLVAPPKEMGQGVQALPCATLETQRRMHPSISELVRQPLYPTLKDSPVVMEHPEVVGMRKRLFWFDHKHPEAQKNADDINPTSHSNPFEVEMTRALVNHLVTQGCYRPRDVAVLTPYLGQLHLLRKELGKSFAIVLSDRDQTILDQAGLSTPPLSNGSGTELSKTTLAKQLRIATVDNFQGEEAKVVVISLVRCNEEKKCGFLRTSNRINVLLSRAQHGMYIIGNSETAATKVQMWADVLAILMKDGNVGPKLELACPRHLDTPIEVDSPDDFTRFSPEGGCNLRCVNRLLCGHACLQRCHSDVLHAAVYCREPCPRPMPNCDHACQKFCGDPCPENCPVDVFTPGRVLPCGHIKDHLPCWISQDVTKFMCWERVQRTVPGCQHLVSVACHVDVNGEKYVCKAKCGTSLPCGHACKEKCKDCRARNGNDPDIEIDHGKCQTTCGRPYTTCSHACKSLCHGEEKCPPCEAKCEVRCSHSECPKKCSEPCQPCAEKRCASICPHSACTMPCSAPCNHIPCSRRCEEKLACGHQCKLIYPMLPSIFSNHQQAQAPAASDALRNSFVRSVEVMPSKKTRSILLKDYSTKSSTSTNSLAFSLLAATFSQSRASILRCPWKSTTNLMSMVPSPPPRQHSSHFQWMR